MSLDGDIYRFEWKLKIDEKTGLASWPLSFQRIEKDFHRPGKDGGKDHSLKTNSQDSEKEFREDKPYVI